MASDDVGVWRMKNLFKSPFHYFLVGAISAGGFGLIIHQALKPKRGPLACLGGIALILVAVVLYNFFDQANKAASDKKKNEKFSDQLEEND